MGILCSLSCLPSRSSLSPSHSHCHSSTQPLSDHGLQLDRRSSSNPIKPRFEAISHPYPLQPRTTTPTAQSQRAPRTPRSQSRTSSPSHHTLRAQTPKPRPPTPSRMVLDPRVRSQSFTAPPKTTWGREKRASLYEGSKGMSGEGNGHAGHVPRSSTLPSPLPSHVGSITSVLTPHDPRPFQPPDQSTSSHISPSPLHRPVPPFASIHASPTSSYRSLRSVTSQGGGRKLRKVMKVEGDWEFVRQGDWQEFVAGPSIPEHETQI